ncbi:hypothetical protein O6H91_09G091000 [Diphasiastrum complanatum]|nr:hypothetical protein O6H91_09G091000 [Diphasiastrum complanatum]
MSALGADQFDDSDPSEKNQENVFFNWYYVALTTGALIAATLLVYIENNISWGLGYGLCAASLGVSLSVFLCGTPYYRQSKPGGNPFVRIAQVLVASARKIGVEAPLNSDFLYEVEDHKEAAIAESRKIAHSQEFRFLDKAATRIDTQEFSTAEKSPWYLCTVSQVEEVKCIIRMTPIWVGNILFSSIYVQMLTLFIVQGATMNTELGNFKLPPATLSTFGTISVIMCTFCYEYCLVPCMRRMTGNQRGLTPLQRMGTGFFIMTLAMMAAAIVEKYRLDIARKHGMLDEKEKPVPMSVFWQIPQFFLVGAAEVFTFIGQLDFFYEQAPDSIRGVGVAFAYISYALGNYVSTLLVIVVNHLTRTGNGDGWISDNLNRGHLDWFFWLMASLSVLNLAVYLMSAQRYKGIKLKSIAATS